MMDGLGMNTLGYMLSITSLYCFDKQCNAIRTYVKNKNVALQQNGDTFYWEALGDGRFAPRVNAEKKRIHGNVSMWEIETVSDGPAGANHLKSWINRFLKTD